MIFRSYLGSTILAICALGVLSSPALGGFFTLLDDNSAVDVDTESQEGVLSWTVDGIDNLFQQWFWYRVGAAAEESVDTLPILVEGATDTNFDGDDDTLFVNFDGGDFEIEIRMTLDGGAIGSGASDLAEQISITNVSSSPLNFHFFQYVDFDLLENPDGGFAEFTNANAVTQTKGAAVLSETVITPVPNHREIDIYPATLDRLNDPLPDVLADTPIGVPVGPDDVTWAFQWDRNIQPGATFQISKDKNIFIPEPLSAALMMLGLIAAVGCRGRR